MNLKNVNRWLRNGVPVLLGVLVLLWFSPGDFLLGQKRFMLNQKDAEKFKMAKRLYTKGEQLFVGGKFKKAESTFKECLDRFPQYANADYYLARIYYQQDNLVAALKHIENANNNYEYIVDLGVNTQLEYIDRLRNQKQQVEEDIRTLQHAIDTSPLPSGSIELEGVRSQIEVAKKTRRMLNDRLRAPIPDSKKIPASFHYVYGNVLFKLKKYSKALTQYLETVKTEPTHGNAYNNLANLYYMAKKYQKALFYLQKAQGCGVKINPKFKQALYKAMRK